MSKPLNFYGMSKHVAVVSLLAVVLLVSSAASVSAIETFSFMHIQESGDGAAKLANGAAGEAQLYVDIIDQDPQVLFRFRNIGPVYCRIDDVYFDDGSLLGIAELIDADEGTGGDNRVDFSEGASPGDLPGGNNVVPAFEVTQTFLADSDPPGQSPVANPYKPGVEPNDQWLGIVFNLVPGRTYAHVIEELNSGGLLRIGLHVQSFPDGGSESFVSVPEPATLGLLLLGGLTLIRRRRR